ncbi:hypothetical protein [uncultured Paracoccus sp.]|uniref:hypothetical protein n=1 Tax=uncultured Paracoccus sp. TaxID=189685 RepID=UPI0026175F67|nr:hypothetical protein [uncultured Paracoccus sp.]
MGRGLHLILILVLVVTGLSLGAARGQVRAAGQVVLCAGSAVTLIDVDRDGVPVQRPHLCPDMALSLLVGLATQDIDLRRPAAVGRSARVALIGQHTRPRGFSVQPRGPPVDAAVHA